MIKKISLVLLTLLLITGCSKGKGEDVDLGDVSEMTTDDITLTYASWQHDAIQDALIDAFEELYPNITVERVSVDNDNWMDGLTNMAGTGELPDAFWYQANVDVPIRNGWLGDMTQFWENDPESKEGLSTLQDMGRFDGERKLAAAVAYEPFAIFLDENVFNKLNVEMPSHDWTYDEMIELMETMTVPEQGIFGYNDYTLLLTMAPIVNGDAVGEFGWDGEKYDLTGEWAKALTQQAEFIRSGVHAPGFDTDEAEAAFGDRLLWSASSGRVALQLDAWWTKNLFATQEFVDKGISWVPYTVPKGANAETEHKPAFTDFGTISPTTKHPREAYELLKFMGWGKQGWEVKLDVYANLLGDDGEKVFTFPEGLPITGNQAIWDALEKQLPQNDYYKNFLTHAKEPIPLGGATMPGFQTFLEEVYFGGDYGNVEVEAIEGNINPSDVAQDLTEKLNQYREEALAELFE